MFGYCISRIITMLMRIVWATRPTNVRIAIAAQVFVGAGILILFLVNLIFAQRITRAAHPHFGWNKGLSVIFKILYALIVVMLAMVITSTVQSFYTLDPYIRRIDRYLQLTAATYLLFIVFLPLPMVILTVSIPRQKRLDKFGIGRWRTKTCILLASTVLLCLGAAFRCGTAWKTPRPINNPAWYHAKWCFYFFNFVVEALVVYLYIVIRVDRRFHVPNGSKRPGDYSGRNEPPNQNDSTHAKGQKEMRLMSEEEVFDDEDEVWCDCEEDPLDDASMKDVEAPKQDVEAQKQDGV